MATLVVVLLLALVALLLTFAAVHYINAKTFEMALKATRWFEFKLKVESRERTKRPPRSRPR